MYIITLNVNVFPKRKESYESTFILTWVTNCNTIQKAVESANTRFFISNVFLNSDSVCLIDGFPNRPSYVA